MARDEIESILHMQWRPLHQGPAYIEDYYYQAFVFKYYGKRNRESFAPDSVRELDPTEKVAPDEVSFVKLEGLGRVPFSNVRRPRPLMDVTPEDLKRAAAAAIENEQGDGDGEQQQQQEKQHQRRLDQEPMLAARIMIEDCMALILDVQDIDRIFTAAAATGGEIENEEALRQRRVLLMEGLTASLRLPDGPVVDKEKSAAASAEQSDGVFMRLLVLPKGQNLAARALQQTYPPQEARKGGGGRVGGGGDEEEDKLPEPNLLLVWAILRNARSIFGGASSSSSAGKSGSAAAAAAADAEKATSAVAAATADVIKRFHSRTSVSNALSALTHGDLDAVAAGSVDPEAVLLPLFAPGIESAAQHHTPWLIDILTALMQVGAEYDMSTENEGGGGWRENFSALFSMVVGHITALTEAAGAAKAEGDDETADELKKLVPVELGRSLLQHCSKEQSERLKGLLSTVSA